MKPAKRQRFVPAYKARRRAREGLEFMRSLQADMLMQTMTSLSGLFSVVEFHLGEAPVPPPDERTQTALH